MDDASTEPVKDVTEPAKDDPKFGDNAPSGFISVIFISLEKKLFIFISLGMPIVLGFYFKTYLSKILLSKFMDV